MKKFRITKPTGSELLAAGSGILFSVSLFSSAFGILGWICFAPLLFALQEKTPRQSLRLGMISGTSMNLVSLYWLVGTLTRFGEIPLIASMVAVFIFCVYSSLQFGIFTWYVSRFRLCNGKSVVNAFMISFAWVVAEFFFPVLFPYGIGISQSYYPTVIQIVDLFGVNFLGFLMLLVNVSVFYTIDDLRKKKKSLFPLAISTTVILIVFGYGSLKINEIENFLETQPRMKIAMVQANFDYAEKNLDNEPAITEKHRKMSREIVGVDLLIWPETSVQHWFPKQNSVYQIEYKRNVVPDGHTAHFLIGGLSFTQDPELLKDGWDEEDAKKYNTVFLVDPKNNILSNYSKTRLFLLGEYFPWINEELRFLKRGFPMIGDLSPGEGPKVLEVPEKNIRIGPLICYEDIMAELSRGYAKRGVNLLVNLTNDAWFGKSMAPYQHLLLSIPRAVETRRYLVRSTNSGISAIISPTGKIEAHTDIFTTENLKGEVVLIDSLGTLYTEVGDIFAWMALAITVLFLVKNYLGRKYAD